MEPKPFRPRRAGELTILSHPYLPRELAGCRAHIFRVHEAEPVKDHECESGYLQRADCLVCGRTTGRMDATWWLQPPSPEARQASLIALTMKRSQAAREEQAAIDQRIAMLQQDVKKVPPQSARLSDR